MLRDQSGLTLHEVLFDRKIPLENNFFKSKISSLRVYLQAVNLFTLTKYRGSDPEVSINGNSINSGKDQNVSPSAQVFSFGMNIGF